MSELVVVNKSDLETIANAARAQTGTTDPYSISELAEAMANVFVPTVTEKWQMLSTNDQNELKWSDLPIVTPQMFGAVGDGTTDDTEAFQTAIDTQTRWTGSARGGMLFIPPGYYAVKELYFYKAGNLTVLGASRSNSSTRLYYTGDSFCINIHGCTHLRMDNFALQKADVTAVSEYSGGIRLFDRDADLTDEEYEAGIADGTQADARNNDIVFNYLKVIGFERGFALDSPAGYVTINETYIEGIQPGGYAISIGENYKVEHRTEYGGTRYAVFPSYIYINKVFCGGDEWTGKEKENPIAALIGMFATHQVFISNCDFCNMKSGYAVYGTDAKSHVADIYMYENFFFNIRNAVYIEKVAEVYEDTATEATESAKHLIWDIHSKANRYFVGNWTESTPITIKGKSGRLIYGVTSEGDVFKANASSLYKNLYDLSNVRNVTIEGPSVTPNSDFFDLWSSDMYSFDNVSNVIGTKTMTLRVEGTTNASGNIDVTVQANLWKYPPCVLTNVADLVGTQYNVTVTAVNDNVITLRFRNIADGSALANTEVNTRIFLTGI